MMGPYVIGSFCAGLLCDGSFCDESFSDGTLCRGTEFTGYVLGRFSLLGALVSYRYRTSEYLKLIPLQTEILLKIPVREESNACSPPGLPPSYP